MSVAVRTHPTGGSDGRGGPLPFVTSFGWRWRAGDRHVGYRRRMKILVISDVHGDARSLDRVLADAAARGWHEEEHPTLFLGDAVGYGPAAADVVARLRALAPHRAIRGNHEAMLARLYAGETPRAHPEWLADLTRDMHAVDDDDLAWLLGLPGAASTEPFGGWGVLGLVHAHPSPERPFDYLLSPVDARKAQADLVHEVTLFGHTHVPGGFAFVDGRWRGIAARAPETTVPIPAGRTVLLNPGAVAEARDGGPSACHLLLDVTEGTATFVRLGT